MPGSSRVSAADAAYKRLLKLIDESRLYNYDGRMTESDTRAKLIDPIFRDVLGWNESEIRREAGSAKGFADYVLGTESNYLLIEAKRAEPSFQLSVEGHPRKLDLSGPHLLGNKRKVKPVIEQAQSYAGEFGTDFVIAFNGSQLVLFRPFLQGRSWKTGFAIVFHGQQDIRDNFAEFFNLLSRDAVVSGKLHEAFNQYEGVTEQLFAPAEFIQNIDSMLVRNRLWNEIAQVLSPLLTDAPENPKLVEEIIRNCYVTTPISDEADASLDKKLKDQLTPSLADAQVRHSTLDNESAFVSRVHRDVESHRPGTYVLTGGVGSGKTTYLKRFATVKNREFIKNYCVWLHLDFLTIGSVDANQIDAELKSFVYREIRKLLDRDYPQYLPRDGEEIRTLFKAQIEDIKKTRLHGIEAGSIEWNQSIGTLVDSLYKDDARFCDTLISSLAPRNLRCVVVLDNTDQQGEDFQESVFLFAQRFSEDHKALCIVALREEKFFAAHRRGVFDAFGDRKFHIGAPDLRSVLARRLDYGRQKFNALGRSRDSGYAAADLRTVDLLLGAVIRSVTEKNGNIVRMLACVSNGDMRGALDLFRGFLSSGNTNLEKIVEIEQRDASYVVPFHEFAKSTILGSRRYYRSEASTVLNAFRLSAARRSSHLTVIRLLARLARAEDTASEHGEGFLSTEVLLREWRASFVVGDDLEAVASDLIRRRLIESEPPRAQSVAETDALRIGASGAYYWRYLVRSFAYLDLVYVDTPIRVRGRAKKLASLSRSADFDVRFERVREFLSYLAAEEEAEIAEVARRDGIYAEKLIPEVSRQIEKEIAFITKRVRVS